MITSFSFCKTANGFIKVCTNAENQKPRAYAHPTEIQYRPGNNSPVLVVVYAGAVQYVINPTTDQVTMGTTVYQPGQLTQDGLLTVCETTEVFLEANTVTGKSTAGSFEHHQTQPLSTWTVNHNLGFRPGGITIIDSAGEQWDGVVHYTDVNTLTINFGTAAFSGTAYIS